MTNTKHVEPNATQDVQSVGSVGNFISRAAAIESIEDIDWYHINQNGELVSGANSQEHEPLYKASDIYAALAVVPTADVVEVVRCKDCEYGQKHSQKYGARVCSSLAYEMCVLNDDFCSYGERRTDG